MPKGPDPRASPAPVEDVPRLARAGAAEWNEGRFWHAHEAWEEAWHALRAAQEPGAAEWLHGLILCAAGLENARRGKEEGFRRQTAEGLYLLREHLPHAARLGVGEPRALLDALAHLYADACRRRVWAAWNEGGWRAPPIACDP